MSDLIEQINLYLQYSEEDIAKDIALERIYDPMEENLELSLDAKNLDLLDVLDLLEIGDQKIEQLERMLSEIIGGLESRKRRILKLLALLRSRYAQNNQDGLKNEFQDHPENQSLNQENRNTVRRRSKALASQSGLDLSRAALHTILRWEVAAGRHSASDLTTKARLWNRQSQLLQNSSGFQCLNAQKSKTVKNFKNNLE